jgi:large subunit ribosomal protein L4
MATTYNKSGAKATTAAKLDASIFEVIPKNHQLLKEAYDAYLANGRENLAVTKTRGLISGGGKKPWKQKGTGRARFGSSRNPIWRGGGIVFGPTGLENYSKQVNVKAKRLATRQALSVSNQAGKLSIVDSIEASGKTADLVKFLTKVGALRTTLIVVDVKSPELLRASANLKSVKIVSAKYLNVFDILNADNILLSSKALTIVNEWLGEKS